MKNIFISRITIENVRHLKNIVLTLPQDKIKHIIFTGKNGSGKTSVLDALSHYLHVASTSTQFERIPNNLQLLQKNLTQLQKRNADSEEILKQEAFIKSREQELNKYKRGLNLEFNESLFTLRTNYANGSFILAYYKADRIFKADIPKHVEKIELKETYFINEEPRQLFIKYLLDLKVTGALARSGGNHQKADSINTWFSKFQDLLKKIFKDDSLELIFDEETFKFYIKENNRELFDFNTLSSGFAAVLDIVLDIIIRMERATNRTFDFNIPGIVLVDEIETHLHLDLQKTILELLTSLFPNIQFIVSTHSPFILNSLDNVMICDLESRIIVENGLSNIPYNGVVEGYFRADSMSNELREKFNRYKELVAKPMLSDDDFEEIADLEVFLNEIPDYLALTLTTEYQRLKLEFENRKDL